MSNYPAALGHRPLEVREAYDALETYAAEYGREPLLLMMHAAVPETLRADLLNLIKLNFLPGHVADMSMEADVLFSPLTTDLGGGYYRIDSQVRWHCMGLLRSLYRDESRSRLLRVAELLWLYVESMEQKAARTANPLLSEFLDVQRWVALAFLDPTTTVQVFAQALKATEERKETAAFLHFGGLTSAIEIPLAHEQELLSYARGLTALSSGDEQRGREILEGLGNDELRIGSIVLRAPLQVLRERLDKTEDWNSPVRDNQHGLMTCFVIQGFGKKTDYTNGRVLNLDASYEVIKEAVEAAGLECVRADEIIHSGTIDVPMYERLLNADLVIADLSTYNVNAAYELGVRFALRPYATIVLAEEQFRNPFDLGHIVIRPYQHLGEDISTREARRLKAELKQAIDAMLNNPVTDSPVFTYLPHLRQPLLKKPTAGQESASQPPISYAAPASVTNIAGEDNPSAKAMLDSALEKIAASDFSTARVFLEEVRKLRPEDPFVIQQLALSTYKSKQPSDIEALHKACQILQELTPETSNNPETLGLWGAIHKRLWVLKADPEYLKESIAAYDRGFYLKQDYYNGINLAYLLNLRAVESLKIDNKDEAIADFVIARRVRRDVIRYTAPLLDSIEDLTNRYWAIATLYEAAIGIGDEAAIAQWDNQAKAMKVADWMQETRIDQGDKLKKLLQEYQDRLS